MIKHFGIVILFIFLFLVVKIYAFGGRNSFKDQLPFVNLDLNKFLGTWYEIARYDSWFEKDLVRVTATYTAKPNGEIDVLNQGFLKTNNFELKIAKGQARIPDNTKTGRLQVSFFWFVWGDYIVIDVAPDYSWILVSGGSPDYLWIISRTPKLDKNIIDKLITKSQALGYDTDRLTWVDQDWNQ